MPFESSPWEILLLSSCLLPGQTFFKESKASVKVEPQAGETILFFNIDEQSNPGCKLRQFLWGTETGQKICDLIVFYAKGSDRVICFVELKDNMSDLGHATEQVINTYNALKVHLKKSYIAKAFISANAGSSPREHQEYQNKLFKVFGQNNFDFNSRSNDALGDLLRGIIPKTGGGKRKNKK
ncbi:MAG: hypothetical protein MUE44_00920 [Oscillatoriaceae cyanobacterium Prado104]|jgi:hypothetical protein|nr:hypothetical protein [Oscillatoriaceae cyanobacterium Prado104]